MGSTTSLQEQRACGLCAKSFDYQKALQKLKLQINRYEESLHKNLGQFKQKDQKIVKEDLNDVKKQALKFLKNNQQLRARKLITEFFLKQQEPKLITRQIDFIDIRQRQLVELRKKIDTQSKPKKKVDRRNQIIANDRELQTIKEKEFNKNQDQMSGDSGDIQAYIDRTMDELKKSMIPPPVIPQKVVLPPPKQKPAIVQPSSRDCRDKFLRKLGGYKKITGERLRNLTPQQVQFFKSKMGIDLTLTSSSSQPQQKNPQSPKVWFGNSPTQKENPNSLQRIDSLNSRQSSTANIYANDFSQGCYLNCDGFDLFDMQEFVKCDWSMIEVLDLQQCGISSHWWRTLAKSKAACLPKLKVLYLGLNQIKEVNTNQLEMLNGVRYLSFGWWEQSNQLNSQSKKVLEQFQQRNKNIKIQFPQN